MRIPKPGHRLAAFSIVLLCSVLSPIAEASPATWLKSKLDKLDRSMCEKPGSVFCSRNRQPRATRLKRREAARKAAAPRAATVRAGQAAAASSMPETVAADEREEPSISPSSIASAPVSPEPTLPQRAAPAQRSLQWKPLTGPVIGARAHSTPNTGLEPPEPLAREDEPSPETIIVKSPVRSKANARQAHRSPKLQDKLEASDDEPDEAVPKPESGPAAAPAKPSPLKLATVTAKSQLPSSSDPCLVQLAGLGIRFSAVTDLTTSAHCSVADPVQLISQRIENSDIAFPDRPVLSCGFALNFAKWVRSIQGGDQSGLPQVSKIYTGPGYQCRMRQADGSSKISEHARGGAVDIERVEFKGKGVVRVADDQGISLAALRKNACLYFTTVLGPGSDPSHSSHFHFDAKERKGGHRICQ